VENEKLKTMFANEINFNGWKNVIEKIIMVFIKKVKQQIIIITLIEFKKKFKIV